MPIGPTTYFGNERVFVDREAFLQAFRDNIQNSENREYNILFYYGIAGIGKSKLQRELQTILDEEHPYIFWVSIDLNTKTYREIGTFLITLRNKIQEKCKAKFYLFNTIHAIYWKKLHPEIPLQKENYPLIKEDGFFSKIIDVLDNIKPGPLEPIPVKLIFDIINNAPDNVKSFFKKQAIDTDKLVAMEAHEIEKILPGFFAADFTVYLGTSSRAYIFIDTYEALWEGLRDKGSFHEKDEWIRDNLIPNVFGVSWVICGREQLLWAECDPDWKMYLEQHSVDELPESYCIEFLEDCGIENKGIRDIIIKASEGVPFYLNLSVDTYEKIKRGRQPVPEDFGRTRPEIFKMFVKYLYGNEIRALEVLSAPNFWDRNLFEILMKKFDTGFPTGAFSELIKFSFINKDADGKCSVHRLMRKSLQEHQDLVDRGNVHKFMFEHYNNKLKEIDIKSITKEHETALTEAFYHAKKALVTKDLFNWFIATSDSFNRAAFWQLIVPMYEEMLQILEAKVGPEHPSVGKTLNNIAGLYESRGDYKKALPLYQRALEINEKVLGPQHPNVSAVVDNIAGLYHHMADYEKALSFYQRALDIRENMHEPQYSEVASTLNNIAGLYESRGDYKKALLLYQRALEINEKVLGPQHLDVAAVLNNLALLYDRMGDYEKTLPLIQRAFEINEKVMGPQHPYFANSLINLAGLYRRMGDYTKALPLYQRALEINEKVLGSQHPKVAINLNNLADLYLQISAFEKALPLYLRALEIYEHMLGSEHPHVAISLNNLAELYRQIGDYEKAFPLYQRALEIHEKVLGPQHPDVATSLNELAEFYRQMSAFEKALPLYQRALEIYERVLGSEHPHVASTLNNLAELYRQIGDYEKAFPLHQRAFDIHEKMLGPQHPDVATSLNNLALLYETTGAYEKALSLHQRALYIQKKMLGPQHPEYADSLNNLAELYRKMGAYEKALPLYQRALDIREKVLGPQHQDVATSLNNLAALYYHLRDYKKALLLFQKAFDIREKVLGPQHLDVANSLKNLATLYYQLRDYEKALSLYQRALEINEMILGPQHPEVTAILNNITIVLLSD